MQQFNDQHIKSVASERLSSLILHADKQSKYHASISFARREKVKWMV